MDLTGIDPVPASVVDAAKRAFTERTELEEARVKFSVELIVEAEDLEQARASAESAADFLNAVEDFSPAPGDEVVTVGIVELHSDAEAERNAQAQYLAMAERMSDIGRKP